MSIKLPGATNGSVEIDVPAAIGSDLSVTIPAIAGEILVANASGNVETSATGSGGSSGSALIVGYQQGTWTPVPSRGSIAGALTPTRWIWSRIGSTVTVSAFVADYTDTTANVISLSGIPYSATNVVSGVATSSRIATTTGGITLCFVRGGIDDEIQFLCTTDSKTNPWVQPQYADTTASSNSTYFTVTYLTDDTTWTPINGATVS